MKSLYQSFFALALSLIAGSASSATILFEDNFNRTNTFDTIGNGWGEIQDRATDVRSINGIVLLSGAMQGNPDAAIFRPEIDATGYENITVSFDWFSFSANRNRAVIYMSYALTPTPSPTDPFFWTAGFADTRSDGVWKSETITISPLATDASFGLMFWTSVDRPESGFTLDNVVVRGDAIIAPVPLPAGAPLLMGGLFVLGALRRKAKHIA